MFSLDMPRTLIPLFLCLVVLSACTTQPPVETTKTQKPAVILYPSVEQWLNLQQEVEAMDIAEVKSRLEAADKSDGVRQLYYRGVLNQRLPSYGAWTVARDAFQKLQENEQLPAPQRQLASIFRQYNQSRINSYQRYDALLTNSNQAQQDLGQLEQDKELLEQKIRALTEVEAAISTRREE
jgi:lipoprotein NlpI